MFDSAKKKVTGIFNEAKEKVNSTISNLHNEANKLRQNVEVNKENATINWEADVDSENERQFRTLLIISVKSGTPFKIKGMNPLEYAFKNDDKYLIKMLIECGFDVNSYKMAIVDSVKNNDIKTTKLLLRNRVDVNAYSGAPLNNAIDNKNIEMVQLLIKNKADVNGENGDPIIHAARSTDIEIMKLLIASKAKVDVKDQQPLKIAMAQRNIEMCKLLLDAGACFETYYELDKILSNAIIEGNVEFVDFLLETWPDLVTRDIKNVLKAIENENVEIVRLFIKYGFDVTINDNVCIITAGFQKSKEMIELLYKNGADVKVKGSLPLKNAIKTYEYNREIAKFFVEKGADPTIVMLDNIGLLNNCDYFAIERAIMLGADISKISFDTFLELASYGKENVMKLLLEHGYKYTCKDVLKNKEKLKQIKNIKKSFWDENDMYYFIIKNTKFK